MKQPWAWVGWLMATLVILSITRNPLYLVLVLLCIAFVWITLHQAGSDTPRPFPVWKLAAWIILLATIFNALTSHYGTTHLFTIPGNLPLISGNVTLESIVYGATNGLVLTGMLASFSVLNLALPVREMISLVPRAFYPLAVVASIAVTYLPITMRQIRQIREAQAIRGHQMRTLRDWLPLWMPLLVGGLEHAMQLAESMTARGFASSRPAEQGRELYPRVAMGLGLVLLAVGWIVQIGIAGMGGLVLMLLGGCSVIVGLALLGHQSPRTAYHQQRWSWKDGLGLCMAACIVGVCIISIPGSGSETLFYEPYPALNMPAFSPWLGLAMLGLILPGIIINRRIAGEKLNNGIENQIPL
jgi:energy-coupling factor transport system permease protein